MKARRGKRSEAFWPSIVMKKWLNIKPKVHEFSEDEVDTETESEDDACSFKDMPRHVAQDLPRARQGNFSESRCQTSGTPLKSSYKKHRRGNSLTLRAQYIVTKDLRVTIGTWNVAGRPPTDDLDIDEWICMEEPSDIYILGFQEVVPLSAGNVLGAETRRPILQWESVIRRTLNKSFEPDTRHKSYSAPPSPVLRTSSAADLLAEVDGTSALALIAEESLSIGKASDSESQKLQGIIGLGKKFNLKRTHSIDRYTRLDWPERPLDGTSQVLSSSSKLRRVFSSSARVGSDWTESAHIFSSQNVLGHAGLRRVHHSSGNLGLMWMEQDEQSEVCDSVDDVLDQCPKEEENSFDVSELEYENALLEDGVNSRLKYVRIVSKQMVGIYISVWVRRRLRRHINNLEVAPVGVGLMGYMGNKGSVSVSMSLFQTRLCFVCSHLTSGHKEGYEQRRNSDVYEIIRRTQFSSAFEANKPLTIPSHDQVFWFGDLNYRINMPDSDVRKLVGKKKWDELLESDQLTNELRDGVFDGWKEGVISFPPTYKYGINSDVYVGENPKEGEKKRSPAWCDRILWLGKGIKQLSYNRAEMWLSDHRPVSSTFLITVEVFDQRKLQKALNVTSAVVHPEIFEEEDWE
ncbi:hypothetical protein DCAR_0209380 [Daucus carota subsp. sativus]|uniref:Inositol polyphosphate-related phosphatase domain-containing protein n=1 Tax=Daucus carota subsp. sativus TaxID=79200 RepID=A0A166F847_DAUCS|nr:PREDICTED: type I inositol polyphosphate 5-phosphatase 2 [Daucus carota subsp. sativus]WOG90137.1 hypothetical protein DCAR_0209380 [Daucus carota subsp. sativus]